MKLIPQEGLWPDFMPPDGQEVELEEAECGWEKTEVGQSCSQISDEWLNLQLSSHATISICPSSFIL